MSVAKNKNIVKSLLFAAAFSLVPVAAHAAAIVSFLPDPTNADADSQYNSSTTYGVQQLYDASPTVSQVGTHINPGGEYARHGSGDADSSTSNFIAIYNYGSANAASFNSLAFQGRGGQSVGGRDDILGFNIWATNTAPDRFRSERYPSERWD